MAKAKVKTEEGFDVTYEGMPGADKVSEEEASTFGEDLSFGLDNQGNPVEEKTNEDTEETDEVEETAEESTETEEEVVTEEEGEPVTEEANAEPTTENDDGDTPELPEDSVEDKQKGPMVPKARLDEVLAKQKALQKQLNEQAQAQAEIQAEAPVYDFDSKELEYQQLVLDMEPEKASTLRQEIRQAEKETMMFEMQQQMGQTVQLSQEAVQLQATAQVLQEQHPILDENSQEYNEATATEVIELRDAFIVQGYQAADALTKATKYVVGNTAPAPIAPKQNVEAIQKKKVAAVKKKIDVSQSQPPELKGQGNAERGEGTLDVNSLSEDEFNALPEETLRRLRGDFG
tara:strand:+ start:5536 stop:6573 length:1038 start_codon:yes stop_codon:yes gene_type:complete